MEIILTLASNLENMSNKKETLFTSIGLFVFVNVNNLSRIIIFHVIVNFQLSFIVNDQDKTFPNRINTISSRQVMIIKKNFI